MTSLGAYFLLQASGGPSPLFQLGIQFALILAIFYFLMIRPQQKQRKQHEEALRNLQKGDEVITSGGVIGQVVHIRETTKEGTAQRSMDDQVTIRSGESRMIIERRAITRITTAKRAEPAPATSSS